MRRGIAHRPVIVVGGGPVGLTLAIDLARYGTPVLLLDDDDKLSSGSRAICFAKRTLEIWDRLGCGEAIASKGVSWNVGKVFFGDRLVYAFDLLPEAGHRRPAFVNLQQYYVEGLLYDHALAQPNLEMRWKHKVVGVEQPPDGAHRHRRDAGRHVPTALRLSRRVRRIALAGARHARTAKPRAGVPRPLPDRRRADGRRPADRAALLVRSAVSSVTARR